MRTSFPRIVFLLGVACLMLGASAFAQAQAPFRDDGADPSIEIGEPLLFPPQAPPPPPPSGCFDTDIQTTAQASNSGGGSGDFGPQVANDGILGPPPCNEPGDGWGWVSAPTCSGTPSGDWIMLEWDGPIDLCQIFVDTKPFPADACGAGTNRIASDAVVQYWNGASWVTAGSVTGQTDDWTFAFQGQVSTSRLRLMDVCTAQGQGGQADNPIFYEIKVYDGTIPVELEKFEIEK